MAVVWMLLGTSFYTFLIGMISSYMSTIDSKGRMLAEKYEYIDDFCKQAHIKWQFKKRMKRALAYRSKQYLLSGLECQSVLMSIPPKLLYQVRTLASPL